MEEPFLSAKELANNLNISLRTIRYWIREADTNGGGIPIHLLPGGGEKKKIRRFVLSEVRDWLEAVAPKKANRYAPPTMGLYQCKSGKNKSDIWYYAITLDGQRIVASTRTKDRKEAEEIYIRAYQEALDGRKEIKTRITLDQAFTEYLAWSRGQHKKKTYQDYCNRSRKLLKYFGVDKKLATIDAPAIEKYRTARKAARAVRKDTLVEGSTINREVMLLQGLFTWALRNGKVTSSPFYIKGAVGKFKEEIGEGRYLNIGQRGRLIECCDERIRAMVVMDLATGMRLTEIRTLQWRCVNLDSRVIQVTDTKSNKRSIMIGEGLLELLKRLPKRSGYVFTNEDGEPFSDSFVEHEFKKACELAGITDFTFHNLRDVFATDFYIQSGKDTLKLKKVLGHRSIKTTERYLAVLGLGDTDVVDKISSELFNEEVCSLLGLVLGRKGEPKEADGKDIMIQ